MYNYAFDLVGDMDIGEELMQITTQRQKDNDLDQFFDLVHMIRQYHKSEASFER